MKSITFTTIIKGKGVSICMLLILLASCKKYITVDTPATSVGTESSFQNNVTAAQVLTGLYAEMAGSIENGTLVSSCILPELSADNLTLFEPDNSPTYVDFYRNSLEPNYFNGNQESTYWMKLYNSLYTVNTAIEHLTNNQKLSPAVGDRLLGEAHFLRAFYYFYLVNFYGEVPLVLSTNYKQNASLTKSSSNEVYNQILNDLSTAERLLDYKYMNGDVSNTTINRLRPNLAAVQALQARVYLYQKNYTAAEVTATKVLSQPGYSLSNVDEVFEKNSLETIWGLQPTEVGLNTPLALLFLIDPEIGPESQQYPLYASESLVNSFEPGDERKKQWLGLGNNGSDYYFINKYKRGFIPDSKDIQEYTIVFRVAELYLIRAEARNEQGKVSDAIADLNAIRNRSRTDDPQIPNPLPALNNSLSQVQLRPVILHERRVELFTEWGHRWFDLRRSGTIDEVMRKEEELKGGEWLPYKIYYPVPQSERLVNPGITQTPGYPN